MPVNRVWGVDLTGKTDLLEGTHPILGIVDHGSRLAVYLQALPNKASITLLRALLDAIERFGKPRAVRSDNEAVFTSRLFRIALWTLGIRHQRTEPHCPWQNGRVERFFGTLKSKLDRWAVDGRDELALALGDFRAWYNHVRPHQHLGGWTPAEAWAGIDPYAAEPKSASYFSAWDGMLTGFHMRR
jgi:transposase InsO family protein